MEEQRHSFSTATLNNSSPASLRAKRSRYLLNWRMGGPQNPSGRCRIETILLPLPGIEPQTLRCPARSLVTLQTELSRLPIPMTNLACPPQTTSDKRICSYQRPQHWPGLGKKSDNHPHSNKSSGNNVNCISRWLILRPINSQWSTLLYMPCPYHVHLTGDAIRWTSTTGLSVISCQNAYVNTFRPSTLYNSLDGTGVSQCLHS